MPKKLLRNGEPEYLDRARNPRKYPYIKNFDLEGNLVSVSTHLMAAEVDDKGNWYVFPTIVQLEDGTLKKFEDPYEAMDFNIQRGNFKMFKNKEKALKYAEGGYKSQAMRDYKIPEEMKDFNTPPAMKDFTIPQLF